MFLFKYVDGKRKSETERENHFFVLFFNCSLMGKRFPFDILNWFGMCVYEWKYTTLPLGISIVSIDQYTKKKNLNYS